MAEINCDNVRKMVIRQINPDKTVSVVTIYFDISTGDILTDRQSQLCNDIQPLQFSCAVVCNPV